MSREHAAPTLLDWLLTNKWTLAVCVNVLAVNAAGPYDGSWDAGSAAFALWWFSYPVGRALAEKELTDD